MVLISNVNFSVIQRNEFEVYDEICEDSYEIN